MIAILVPSRGRPEQFLRLMNTAYSTASSGKNFTIYSYIADDDNTAPTYAAHVMRYGKMFTGSDYPTAYKWNLLAEQAMKDGFSLFMLGADDMIFATPCWDEALINHYNSLERKQHVYHLQDSRDINGTPHPIVTREYIQAMGYFMPPQFLHWQIDTWTVDIATSNNCFTHLRDYELIHDKPSDKGNPDETHSRIRDWGWHERDEYVDKVLRGAGHLDFEKRRLMSILNHGVMAA